jgi:CIC family chloride channel protein
MIKDIFREPDNVNNSLISAGAAAGLASAFNAPFAGIIFVIEEMHEHFKFNFYSVSAIIVASGTADFVVKALVNDNPIIQMTVFPSPNLSSLWMFIILGLLFSIVGFVYNKLLIVALDFFKKLSKIPIIILGSTIGIVIVFIGIFFPDMIGGGYGTFAKVLDQSFTLSALVILFLVRIILSALSYGTGALTVAANIPAIPAMA